jgi:type I restriction enzyme S subunit
MKLETFFEKFDQIADAPDAVAKMRELVLDLAATGRLVPRKGEWGTRQLNSLATKIGSGATPAGGRESYFSKGIPLIRSMNVHFRGFDPTGLVFLSDEQADELSNVTVQANDVLLNITGASIGRVTIAPSEMAGARVNQHVTIIRPTPELFPRFLSMFLASPSVQRMIDEIQVGATRQALTKGMIEQFAFPLPTLAEQKRIVAKVDELMALCDRLEAQQQERETRHAALARASLARFADAPTPANLPFLFHPSYAIPPADLRKSILTLAVQGKLVPQDPNDEPAEKLVVKLESERRRFAVAHKFRAPVGEPLDDSSAPFAIPSSWKWCRLSSMFNAVADGDHLPPPKSETGIAFLTIGNITTGTLDFEGSRFVPDSYYRGLADFRRPIRGDILYTIVGATYGRPALVESDRPFCVQRHIAILKPPQSVDVGFLMAVLRSPLAYNQASASTTGTAQPTIPLGSLRNFAAPLPPLAEQRRIVAKVEQLMALVDALETQLAASRATAANLLSALVAELTT